MSVKQEKWLRPKSVKIPTVWRRFDGLKPMEDGKVPKFRIQDLPEDMHDDFAEFMETNFSKEEATSQSLKVLEDPVTVVEMHSMWRELMRHNVALVAFRDDIEHKGQPKIVGCNLTCISYKSEAITADMFQGRCSRIIVKTIVEHASKIVDVYEKYGVDEYLSAMGLSVDPAYRGQGLGLEILKARFDMGRAMGLKATMTIFTGLASQKLAHKLGMELLAEVKYEDYTEDGKPLFPNINCKSLKVMGKIID